MFAIKIIEETAHHEHVSVFTMLILLPEFLIMVIERVEHHVHISRLKNKKESK